MDGFPMTMNDAVLCAFAIAFVLFIIYLDSNKDKWDDSDDDPSDHFRPTGKPGLI